MTTREQLVEDFERTIGQPLPEDYRAFLVAGAVPSWPDEESPENPHTELLHSFYDFEPEDDWRDLASAYENRSPDLPPWFLQIAEQYGVLIGIGVSGPHRGRVYQWSWDDGEERELAASFEQFLADVRADEAAWKPGSY